MAEHEYLDVLSKVLRRRAPSSPMTRRTSKKRNESATGSYDARRVSAGQARNRVSAPHTLAGTSNPLLVPLRRPLLLWYVTFYPTLSVPLLRRS